MLMDSNYKFVLVTSVNYGQNANYAYWLSSHFPTNMLIPTNTFIWSSKNFHPTYLFNPTHLMETLEYLNLKQIIRKLVWNSKRFWIRVQMFLLWPSLLRKDLANHLKHYHIKVPTFKARHDWHTRQEYQWGRCTLTIGHGYKMLGFTISTKVW